LEADELARRGSLQCEEAKVLGTAAALGGAAGMLLMGPISAASLGAMAAYATTREDPAGAAARKVCTASIGAADCAVNKAVSSGLKAADFALEEGRRRLLDAANGSASAGPTKMVDWCSKNKDKCIRAVAAVEAIQGTLPRHKLADEARRMRARYPDRVPVICERAARSDLPDIDRNKFAVPGSMSCGEFKYIIHKQVAQASRGLAVDQTIYVFVNGVSPRTSATMAELYELHGSEDGFLYVLYCAENTLGRRCACT
jgi:GABA(A) receptor-associated protein